MEKQTLSPAGKFWVGIVSRLNSDGHLYRSIPDILKDTCDFFDFGCGFIYQANYASTFFLRESYILYKHSHLSDPIELGGAVGPDNLAALATQSGLRYTSGEETGPLGKSFASLFRAQCLVLIPVVDHTCQVIALVGLADRRAKSRKLLRDMDLIQSILSAVANHVKLQIYQDRFDATMASLENVVDNMGVELYVNDYYTHEVLFANKSVAEAHGGAGNLVGKTCWKVLADGEDGPCAMCPQPHVVNALGQPCTTHVWDYRRTRDGRWMHMTGKAFHWVDGRLAMAISGMDITDKKESQDLAQRLADYDTLTGLLNRRRLMEDLPACLEALERRRGEGYVLFMDLDGFKKVNDTLGHRAGDELLRRIGEMLLGSDAVGGKCYRNGGDEFVVLCENGGLERVRLLLDWLLDTFATIRLADGVPNHCSISIGVAHYPGDATDPEGLLHCADIAMYAAKQAGGGQAMFYRDGAACPPAQYYAARPGASALSAGGA